MTKTILMAGAAAMLLGGCSMLDSGPPPKRQPGSWTSKIEVTNITGKDADKAKAQMNAMFGMMSAMSVCVTPEAVAKEDPAGDIGKFGGNDCTFDQKDLTGKDISFSGTCKSGATPSKISVKGTLATTTQDFTIAISGNDPANGPQSMELKVHNQRNGECTDKDIKPAVPGAAPAAPPEMPTGNAM